MLQGVYLLLVIVLTAFLGVGIWQLRQKMQQRRVRVAAALAISQRNEAIVDASGEGVLELDAAGMVVFANPAAARLLGYEAEEMQGLDYRRLMSAGGMLEKRDTGRIGYTTDMLRGIGANLHCRNGRIRPVEYRMVALRHNGKAGSLIAFRDLTERARIDVMLADMQHLAKIGAWELGVDSTRLSLSEGIRRHLGLDMRNDLPLSFLLQRLVASDRRVMMRLVLKAIRHGDSFDQLLALPGETPIWLRCIGKPERVEGAVVRLYGTLQDVTERIRSEQALSETRDFFGATLDAMPSLVLHLDQQKQLTYCNHSALRRWLRLTDQSTGMNLVTILDSIQQPQVSSDLVHGVKRALIGQTATHVGALMVDDQPHQAHFSFVPQKDAADRVMGCFLVMTDVSDMKLLEARVFQAEKMQAVGQLTGGVAHDFNNLLGVVLGNLQLIERDVTHDAAISKKLATAMRAAMRGAELTKNLLSFARRQVLDPVIIDLGKQLPVFAELIQRTLDDSIEMQLTIPDELWLIEADLGQLENAILNLVINARDAMPQGGTLMLSARNVHPDAGFRSANPDLTHDDYVAISVRDTGSGIPEQVLNRVFEPFFTTKEAGKGSGLGLAMVHGFAKQSGGTVQVDSEVGKGTCISIYLPRSHDPSAEHEETLVNHVVPGGNEVILVVEDDTDLRATTILNLHRLGYQVLEASNGPAALRILQDSVHIDMLFTDVIMPGGILGPELAQQARALRPGIKVLLTTGYLGDSVLSRAGSMAQEELLAKPYRNEQLALKLRYMLDR